MLKMLTILSAKSTILCSEINIVLSLDSIFRYITKPTAYRYLLLSLCATNLWWLSNFLCLSAKAVSVSFDTNDFSSLSDAITAANNDTSSNYTINISSGIALNGLLPTITGANISFVGTNSSAAIDGQSKYEGFFIKGGNVSFSNLTIQNGLAQGGSSGKGGGGLGAGGALFIQSGTVTTTAVNFYNNQAIGGSSTGVGNGRGGDLNSNYGGGASGGGSGGFGGGGSRSGNGGFGGGGGSGAAGAGSNSGTSGNGFGGFGGGDGGSGNQGGGGAGLGGAIFIRSGSLTLGSNDTFLNNSATGGSGYKNGSGYGGAIFIDNPTIDTGITTAPSVISLGDLPQFSGNSATTSSNDTFGTIQSTPVPEPITMLGSTTALIIGGMLKRKFRFKEQTRSQS